MPLMFNRFREKSFYQYATVHQNCSIKRAVKTYMRDDRCLVMIGTFLNEVKYIYIKVFVVELLCSIASYSHGKHIELTLTTKREKILLFEEGTRSICCVYCDKILVAVCECLNNTIVN